MHYIVTPRTSELLDEIMVLPTASVVRAAEAIHKIQEELGDNLSDAEITCNILKTDLAVMVVLLGDLDEDGFEGVINDVQQIIDDAENERAANSVKKERVSKP